MDTNGVLLVIVILLAFYYACYCSEGVRVHSEMFNNLRVMLAGEGAMSRNYNTRGGASSANRQANDTLKGTTGQNGRESKLVAEVTPEDLFQNSQERPQANIYDSDM